MEAQHRDNGGGKFSCEFQPLWETHDLDPPTPSKMPQKDAVCFMLNAINIGEVLNLANEVEEKIGNHTFTFESTTAEFGTDNCATHHICYLK